MVKHFGNYLKIFISIILLFTFMPMQTNASQDEVSPKVISSSISERTIAYKGIENPGFTSIKFKTDKPVVAYLEVSSHTASTKIRLNDWLNKKSEYEVFFVPMDYQKALYDQFVPLAPGTYTITLEIIDDGYNKTITGLGTINVVKENKEQPLIEILDIKIINEVKDLQIEPKMIFQYRVNRPAFIETPIFRDYSNEYVRGESTQIDSLSVENYITTPGIYKVAWDLKPPRRIFRNSRGIITIQPNDKDILTPNKYKLFFRSREESIKKYASQNTFVLNNDEEIDILITSNKNNTEIRILNGWAPQFDDIQDNWSKDNILFLSSRKIIEGVGNNKFNPNKNISRAEYLTMIIRALNINVTPKDKSKFKDVQPNEWYHDFVETALELDLITGYEDNTFKPNKSVTRQEMTAIAEKALHYEKDQQPIIDENILDVLEIYNDKDNIGSWARTCVAIATKYNLVKGKANNLFDPNGISTRAEGATIVKRLYDYINVYNK